MENKPIFLNQKDLSQRWGISHLTLEKWRVYGKGPRYLKLSNRVRYNISDIEAYEGQYFLRHTSDTFSNSKGRE